MLPGDEEIHVVSFKNLVLPFIGLDQACLLLALLRQASHWPYIGRIYVIGICASRTYNFAMTKAFNLTVTTGWALWASSDSQLKHN